MRHDGVAEHPEPMRASHTFGPPDRKAHHPLDELGHQASSIVSWPGCGSSEDVFPSSDCGLVWTPCNVRARLRKSPLARVVLFASSVVGVGSSLFDHAPVSAYCRDITVSDVIVSPAPLATFFSRCAAACLWSSCATGVGSSAKTVASGLLAFVPLGRFHLFAAARFSIRPPLPSAACGVGNDEEPLALHPHFGKVGEDSGESESKVPCDVFSDDEAGS